MKLQLCVQFYSIINLMGMRKENQYVAETFKTVPVNRMTFHISLSRKNRPCDGLSLHGSEHLLGILESLSGTGHLARIDSRLILRARRPLSELRCPATSIATRRNTSVHLAAQSFGASG